MGKPKIAVIGMAQMGSNLAANFASKGYDTAIFNRTDSRTKEVYDAPENKEFRDKLHPVYGNTDIKALVDKIGSDGIFFIMIKAGKPTDEVIDSLREHLKPGAIIVDLANSNWLDTVRRFKSFENTGIDFFGVGVSGGEMGARYGPSIMAGGGSREAYDEKLRKILEDISGKAPQDGLPCAAYIGKNGAGHFVKMIHNGIEYGDMELIAETYDILRNAGLNAKEIGDVFSLWNKGRLNSYLIEIAAEVLHQNDPLGKGELVDMIKDRAEMKGTGTWAVDNSLRLAEGVEPNPTIYSAVETRAISSRTKERDAVSSLFPEPKRKLEGEMEKLISDLEKALYFSKIASYTQGISLMQRASKEYDFGGLNIAEIAQIWRSGCIIRAGFLGEITKAYQENPNLVLLMTAPIFRESAERDYPSLKRVCNIANDLEVPIMAFDSAKNYFLQLRNKKSPMNLIQGLRDFFGAHTYERTDVQGKYHLEWEKQDRPQIKAE